MKLKVYWQGLDGLDKKNLEKAIKKEIEAEGIKKAVEVSVSLVDEQTMTGFNQQYMGKSGATDVLAFPLEKEVGPDEVMRLGDVVVCRPVAERQARTQRMGLEAEVARLIGHGVRHLLGIHHK